MPNYERKEARELSGARRFFQEHPWKAILESIITASVLLGTGYFIRNAFLYEGTDDAQVNGHIMPLSARITGYVLEVPVVGLPAEKTNAAAGLMNFMRNMGQSIGTSAVTTLIARRSQYHQSVLAEYTASGRFHASITALAMRLTAGLSAHAAQQQALARMYALVQSQAAVLSYVEVYWLLAMASTIMFASSFLLKRNEPGKRENVSVH